jgi:hypothetical protein
MVGDVDAGTLYWESILCSECNIEGEVDCRERGISCSCGDPKNVDIAVTVMVKGALLEVDAKDLGEVAGSLTIIALM